MLGFSIYLNEDWSEEKEACIHRMAAIGMEGIFTSLQLPEDDPSQYRKRLAPLLEAAKRNGMKVMIYISGNVLHHIGLSIDDPARIIESG
ncbi:MupG family TIM beta-alpha barrel fold protein, partial [Limosilactobacillus reuteri]|uniref:MupG family TIM beta-alpha barrel fold protein n=1 Tax=Limosilactobacillus reuteri TaxID=1598 RepID=UPI0034600A9F